MKWIGQHIYDLISRFRNDVYLENISSGTIASGGNLGLDANNKIVKANEATGDITSISLAAGSGIDLTGVLNASGGDYEARIDVDVSDFMSSGAQFNVLTATGADAMQAEPYLQFRNTGNVSSLSVLSNEDTGDKFTIATTTNGVTTLSTTDDDATAANFEIAADGNITLDAAGDIALEAGGDDLTLDADTFTFTSATTQKPNVFIEDTSNDADGSRFIFNKNRGAAGQDADLITALQFKSYNDAGTPEHINYAQIVPKIHDASDGVESGQLLLQVQAHGGGNVTGLMLTGGSQDDEVDVTVGLGTSSLTTIAGDLEIAGTISSLGTRISASLIGTGTVGNTEFGRLNNIGGNIQDQLDDKVDINGTNTTDGLIFTSANQNDPAITIQNTHNGATGARLEFKKDRGAAGVDGDDIGIIDFIGDDSAQTLTSFAQIKAEVSESLDTDEAGKLTLNVAASDGTTTELAPGLILEGEHATSGEVDVTIANGVNSTTTIAGSLRPKGQIQIITCNWKGQEDTDSVWIPLGAAPEEKDSNNFTNEQSVIIMPCDGYVKELLIRAQYDAGYTSENITIQVYTRAKNKKMNGQSQVGSDITVAAPTQDSSDNDNNTRSTGDLGTSYPYNRGDALGIQFQWASTGPAASSDKTYITVVLENDMTSLGY